MQRRLGPRRLRRAARPLRPPHGPAPSQATSFVPGHNLSHHKYLQTRKDIMRTSRMKYRSQLLNLLLFFPSILHSIQRNDVQYMLAQRRKSRAIYDWFVTEFVAYHGLLVCLLLLDWRKCLLMYFVPGVLAKNMLVSLNMLQHDGCDPKSRYNHSRNFTNDALNYLLFNNGALAAPTQLLARSPRRMPMRRARDAGYHTIHHMMPGVHWSLTKAKHDAIVKPHIHPNLLEPTIIGYVWRVHLSGRRRVNYDGSPYTDPGINTEDGPDEPWFYEQASLNASGSNPDEQLEGKSTHESVTARAG